MLSAKSWIYYSLLILFSLFLINILFLYHLDTFNITHKNRTIFPVFQQRFLTIEYLKEHLSDYNSFIFGSSRSHYINPLQIPNWKTYDISIAEGIPHDYLLMLKYFINEKKIIPKNILIALDDFSYQVSFKEHQYSLERKSHYLITQESLLNFYQFYFFRLPTKLDIHFLFHPPKKNKIFTLYYNMIFHQTKAFRDFANEKNSKTNVDSPVFNNPIIWQGNYMEETLHDIRDIKKICNTYDINCTFFINPIHHTTYKYRNKPELKKFKNKLAKITAYYDFSLPNKISSNNKYWIETSHFKLEVGDMILNRLIKNDTSIKNFGIFIPKSKEKN